MDGPNEREVLCNLARFFYYLDCKDNINSFKYVLFKETYLIIMQFQ